MRREKEETVTEVGTLAILGAKERERRWSSLGGLVTVALQLLPSCPGWPSAEIHGPRHTCTPARLTARPQALRRVPAQVSSPLEHRPAPCPKCHFSDCPSAFPQPLLTHSSTQMMGHFPVLSKGLPTRLRALQVCSLGVQCYRALGAGRHAGGGQLVAGRA